MQLDGGDKVVVVLLSLLVMMSRVTAGVDSTPSQRKSLIRHQFTYNLFISSHFTYMLVPESLAREVLSAHRKAVVDSHAEEAQAIVVGHVSSTPSCRRWCLPLAAAAHPRAAVAMP